MFENVATRRQAGYVGRVVGRSEKVKAWRSGGSDDERSRVRALALPPYFPTSHSIMSKVRLPTHYQRTEEYSLILLLIHYRRNSCENTSALSPPLPPLPPRPEKGWTVR